MTKMNTITRNEQKFFINYINEISYNIKLQEKQELYLYKVSTMFSKFQYNRIPFIFKKIVKFLF